MISYLRWTVLMTITGTTVAAMAGGELQPGQWQRAAYAVPSNMPAPRSIERHAIRPVYRPGDEVTRNMPLPAPYRPSGHGKELNPFYGPTSHYPSAHNNSEGLHPTYYPFLAPNPKATNYKAAGLYCPGQQCGSSRSLGYWDSYDEWVRGGRYGQHQ